MQLRTIILLGLGLTALGACSDDDGSAVSGPDGPQAYIRFVNAGADTGVVDFRFVDELENLPTFLGLPFRGVSGAGYVGVRPGTRPTRVFVNSTNPAEAQKMLVDTTITLAANGRYTLVYAGNARGNNDRLAVIEDVATLPAPDGGLALRVLHAAVGTGPATVTVTPAGVDASSTPAATFADVAYLTLSEFQNLAARPSGAGNLYTFDIAAGATSFSVTPAEPGALPPAGQLYGPTPGMQIPGSVITAVVVPGAVEGSRAATASNLSPSVILLFDKPISP